MCAEDPIRSDASELDKPIRVEVIKDDDLSNFEKKTVSLGKYGLIVAVASLLAACAAAVFVYQQFKEMAAQTEFLSRAAKQARTDSANSSIAIAEQLKIAQQQAKAAQASVQAIQRQTIEQERPWVAVGITPTAEFRYNAKEAPIMQMDFTLTNIGHSVAEYVSIWNALVLDGD